ncbi:hypothetical protein BCR42DRAFT_388671 [Absidia repens]|uniref:Uncharacterized protein n=1 Tax=Absidia repens TaxID=90262 RepID=A0A1X2IUM7_9FUNG|nr:hypothetical protein BCR42DRAFT_388671 [Absidia repens]
MNINILNCVDFSKTKLFAGVINYYLSAICYWTVFTVNGTVKFYRYAVFTSKTQPKSSRVPLNLRKSSTYECGFYLKTLFESSCLLLTLLESSTYECGFQLRAI